jgi:hypothetical protein
MEFSDLQSTWTGQPERGGTHDLDVATIIAKAGKITRRTRVRDYVELGTAVALAALFFWIGTMAPVWWPWVAAGAITMGVGLVFVRERLRAPGPLRADVEVRSALQSALEEANHQIALLSSVTRWYLSPLAVVVMLVLLGTMLGVRAELPPEVWARGRAGLLAAFAVAAAVVAALFWVVWWLNRRTVTTLLAPHRDALADTLRGIDGDGDQ